MQTIQSASSNSSFFSSSRRRLRLDQAQMKPHATWTNEMFQLAQLLSQGERAEARRSCCLAESESESSLDDSHLEEEAIRLQQLVITKVRRHQPEQRKELLDALLEKYRSSSYLDSLLLRFLEHNYESLLSGRVPVMYNLQELKNL
jgi:hypothetical protein